MSGPDRCAHGNSVDPDDGGCPECDAPPVITPAMAELFAGAPRNAHGHNHVCCLGYKRERDALAARIVAAEIALDGMCCMKCPDMLAERDQLQSRIIECTAERDDLRAQLAKVRADRDTMIAVHDDVELTLAAELRIEQQLARGLADRYEEQATHDEARVHALEAALGQARILALAHTGCCAGSPLRHCERCAPFRDLARGIDAALSAAGESGKGEGS